MKLGKVISDDEFIVDCLKKLPDDYDVAGFTYS